MSTYKTDQCRVVHRGREFHFVSYDATLADPRSGEPAHPATWYLMSAGKRWPAMIQVNGEDASAVVAALTRWLEANVFSGKLG